MTTEGTWRIDPKRTAVRLRARALGIPATCEISIVDAIATVTDDGRTGAIRARLDSASFRSGNDRRDAHVRSRDFLDAVAHPVITFVATWVGLPTAPGSVTGVVQLGEASTRSTLSVTAHDVADGTLAFSASALLSRRSLGILKARFVLSDRVDVSIEGVAAAVSPSEGEIARESSHSAASIGIRESRQDG